MAKNPNNAHENRHAVYLATSGGGKTTALKQNPEIPKNGRVVIWDPYEDHDAERYTNRADFIRALDRAAASGKPFRIALTVDMTQANFEFWAKCVWAILDGNKITYPIIEEFAEVSRTAGKEDGTISTLLRGGRKFGARCHLTSQRPAEVPKSVTNQCAVKWIGWQDPEDAKRMAKMAGVTEQQILDLEALQFWKKEAGPHGATLIKLKKPVNGRTRKKG